MMKLNSKLIGAITLSMLSTAIFAQDWLVGGNTLGQMGGNPPSLGTMAGNNQPLNLHTNGIQRMNPYVVFCCYCSPPKSSTLAH